MEGSLPSKERIAWTEKYRPRTLDQIAGHLSTVQKIRTWGNVWKDGGMPKKRGLILEGEAGVGKTTAAFALAREMGWEIIELNASDARNLEAIRKMATRGAQSRDVTDFEGFSGKKALKNKLILLDEADNLYERSASAGEGQDVGDRGGKRAIVELLKLTRHPIILIVNNLYGLTSGAGSTLNFTCEKIRFRKLSPASVAKRLREICSNEKMLFSEDVIMAIAERSGGDLRSAIGDLQIICTGKSKITVQDLDVLGYRDTKENIFKVMEKVFNANSVRASRRALGEVDEDINTLILWMAENVPVVMTHPDDLSRAYSLLSRSDVYLGRVRRRQNYKLWSYAKDTLASIPTAKRHPGRSGRRFQFPSYLKSMARTKDSRAKLKQIASALASMTHTSIRYQKDDALHRMGLLCQRDPEFASHIISETGLTRDHLKLLTRGKLNESDLKSIMEGAASIEIEKAAPVGIGGGLASFIREEEEEKVEPKKVEKKDEEEEEPQGSVQSSLFEF